LSTRVIVRKIDVPHPGIAMAQQDRRTPLAPRQIIGQIEIAGEL